MRLSLLATGERLRNVIFTKFVPQLNGWFKGQMVTRAGFLIALSSLLAVGDVPSFSGERLILLDS